MRLDVSEGESGGAGRRTCTFTEIDTKHKLDRGHDGLWYVASGASKYRNKRQPKYRIKETIFWPLVWVWTSLRGESNGAGRRTCTYTQSTEIHVKQIHVEQNIDLEKTRREAQRRDAPRRLGL